MLSRVLLGLVLGVVLGFGRLHAGADLLSLPQAEVQRAAAVRGIALLVVGAGILLARGLFPAKRGVGELLAGATVGFAAVGLGLGWPRIQAPWWLAFAAMVASAALARLGSADSEAGDGPEPRAGSDPPSLSKPGHAALALGAAGIALCVDGLFRGLAMRGGGLAADDAVFGTVFLAAMLLGGVVLSSATTGTRRADGVAPLCALAAGASFLGMLSFAGLAPKEGLAASLDRIGEFISAEGTLVADAWIATLVLLPPALLCGAAIFGARRASELATVAFGAAAGVTCAPLSIQTGAAEMDLGLAPSAMRLILIGAGVAGAGAVLGAVSARGALLSFPRVAGALGAVLCGVLAFTFQGRDLEVELVRGLRPIRPVLVVELPEGQLQVDPPQVDGAQLVMLGKRAIAPDSEHARVDDLCLSTSFELSHDRTPAESVLLVGQLTPRRARVLTAAGARHIDRSAAWWRAMPALEALLFGPEVPPAGAVLEPDTARERIANGDYDLVIVAPISGSAPLIPADLELPETTVVVAWIDAAADDLAVRTIGRPVALVLDGIEQPHIGIVWGRETQVGRAPDRTPLLAAGAPLAASPSTLARLGLDPWLRPDRNRLELMERLQAAAGETVHRDFTEGLRLHAAVQTGSSPFETREQRVEIDEEALDRLFESALEAEPDATLREVWNGACRVLRAKRDVTSMYRFLEPLEAKWGPWPEMVVALAECDLEELEHEDALARLATIVTDETTDVDQLVVLARAHDEAGDLASSAAVWGRALAQRPGDPALERPLGIALLKSGDETGRPILERIFAHDPADTTVRDLLGIAPEENGDHDGH